MNDPAPASTSADAALAWGLHARPESLFRSGARSILALVPEEQLAKVRATRTNVKVEMTSEGTVEMSSRKRRFPLPGYVISVDRGFYQLIFDSIQVLMTRAQIVSGTGAVRVAAELPEEDATAILRHLIRNYVTNGRWGRSHVLEGTWQRRALAEVDSPDRPPKVWFLFVQQMVFFLVAHEVAHILYGHCAKPSPPDRTTLWADELAADGMAAFIQKQYVRTSIASPDMAEMREQALQVTQVVALTAVAVLFETLSAIALTREALGVPGGQTHPPAAARYLAFREWHSRLGTPAALFDDVVIEMNPPELTRQLFARLTSTAHVGL